MTRSTTASNLPRLRRRAGWGALGAVVAVAGLIGGAAAWTHHAADGHVYPASEAHTAPSAPVALVLGAGVQPDGRPSPFLAARLDAARDLYRAGRTRALIVSGERDPASGYDEPGTMRAYLVARGVPAAHIVTDDSGNDTYTSCTRAHHVFGVTRLLVVSQTYHLPRAIALCRAIGLDADGVGDDTMRRYDDVWRYGELRELGANLKAAADALLRPGRGLEPPRPDVHDALRAR